jgi:transcription elongation GreA/GreB family factor
MSRAFVREPDGDQREAETPPRPPSEHPNYITVAGHARLQRRLEGLRERLGALTARDEDLAVQTELRALAAEVRHLEERLHQAIPIDVAAHTGEEVRFGASVELLDAEGRPSTFTIVGEDEADPDNGAISWISPLACELLSRRPGDVVLWRRPAGDLELEIARVWYEAASAR